MKIRNARPGESEELSALAKAAKAFWGYSARQLALWSAELRISPEAIASEPTFVAEEGGCLVGVAQLDTKALPWAVECLWVHPSASRRGVGTQLLRRMLAHAQAAGQRGLQIDADPNAAAFYLHLGAHRVGEVAAPIEGQPGRVRPQLMLGVDGGGTG